MLDNYATDKHSEYVIFIAFPQKNILRTVLSITFMRTLSVFAEYDQQDVKFHNLFISVKHSTCFRRVFRPPSGAQNCTYSVRYWSDKYLTLYVQFWAPDDGRKNRLKHAERLAEVNKLWNLASCWLYSANIVAMHGPMNVKNFLSCFVCHI